ncbi:MAG: cupin domain-containing protein [Acidimicrobiia bacterium]
MKVERILDVLNDAPEVVVGDATTREEVRAAYRAFGAMDDHGLGGRRWSGLSPWERHPGGDELLLPLVGGYEVTMLTDEGRTVVEVAAGSLLVVPRGVWHRLHARETVVDFGVNAVGDDEISFADDPRSEAR